jgi:hypothetical protein
MSRVGILQALRNYAPLTALVPANNIYPNYSRDEPPSKTAPFIIIKWQESMNFTQTYTGMSNGLDRAPRVLLVQAHIPKEKSTSFSRIDKILDRIDEALLPLEQVADGKGKTITCVRKAGRGSDLFDEGYNTITRQATYGVLTHDTVSSEL